MRLAICLAVPALAWATAADAAQPGAGLTRDLRSPESAVRIYAARRLGERGDPGAVGALIGSLGDADAGVRREAARALGRIRDKRAVDGLCKALRDADTNVRFHAAGALGEIRSPKAAEALAAALRDPEWCVRDQAAWALRGIATPEVMQRLAAALKAPGVDIRQIVWILRDGSAAAAVAALAGALESTDAEARRRAVGALATLDDAAAVDTLLGALKDDSPAVRLAAVDALTTIGDRRALGPLEELARREKDASVRQAAERAVERFSRNTDLLAHWSFDDGDAKVARDVTGHGSDGQVIRCTPVAGKVGQALRFTKGAYVELGKPAAVPIADSPLTIMAWAKPEAPTGVVVARGGASCGFSLYVKDGAPRFGIHRTPDGPTHVAAAKEKVVGQWVHLAGVVKPDRIELYVNGAVAATAKTPGLIPSNAGQGMEIGFDAGNSPAEIVDAFEGVIDEVKVYRVALSAEEIARHCRPAKDE